MKAIHRSQELKKCVSKPSLISIEEVDNSPKRSNSPRNDTEQTPLSIPEPRMQLISSSEVQSQNATQIPLHQYLGRQWMAPELTYNEPKLRSLAFSSDLMDLRLAATRYASAFHSLRRHELALQPMPSSLVCTQPSMPQMLSHKLYEHLIPRYDARTLLMLPSVSNVVGTGATPANSLTHNWLLPNLVRN